MENSTVCPRRKYWYVALALALVVVGWAVYKFTPSGDVPSPQALAGVRDLTTANFDAAVASGVTLVDFWAAWCGPCRAQMPIIAETVSALPPGVKIAKVNIDEARDLAVRFQVEGVPTWIVFRDGKPIRRIDGLQSKKELLALAQVQ